MNEFRPKRGYRKTLEGAPEYVLDCFDNKDRSKDRYTILLGGSQWHPRMGRNVKFIALSDNPTSPQGICQWGTCPSNWRPAQYRVKWLDLPAIIRSQVVWMVAAS